MKLPLYQQEQPHTCAVTCLRIVAAYYGFSHTEAELLELCQTTLDGTTPEDLVYAARQLGLSATLTFEEPTLLPAALYRQQPVTVYLGITSAEALGIHAVVVTDCTAASITFIDPNDGQAHTTERSVFNAAWEQAFFTAILLTPA